MRPAEKRRLRKEAEEAARPKGLRPLNRRQGEFLRSIDANPLTVAWGPAGTSKTYLPAVRAVEKLEAGEVKRIVLCRPAVAAGGEQHGFLPGDIRAKIAPWVLPILDAMEERLGSKGKVDDLLKDGRITAVPFTYMRGRTFKDAFVILDEAQNTTPDQMKLFVTRLGEGSTVVVSGDISGGQSDIRGGSGLADLVRIVRAEPRLAAVTGLVRFGAEDVVRSGLCQMFVEAYEREEDGPPGEG